jgi:hypothetical protein
MLISMVIDATAPVTVFESGEGRDEPDRPGAAFAAPNPPSKPRFRPLGVAASARPRQPATNAARG